MPLYDFKCSNDHVSERFVSSDTRESDCDLCCEQSVRQLSAPQRPAFGMGSDQWVKKREQKLKQERRANS
jgi:hypothetical protein